MSQLGTNTRGSQKDNVRIIHFQQVAPDPATLTSQNSYPNIINIKFPYPQSFTNCSMSLVNLYMYYSWYNISASFGNNTFSYAYPNSVGGYTTYQVVIPDGFYSLDELNQYFQQVQLYNGTYTSSSTTGVTTTYLSFVTNVTYYRVTLFASPVPATGTAGVTFPSNYPSGSGGPPVALDPTFTVLPTGYPAGSISPGSYSFSKVIGFLPGTYPLSNNPVSYSINGQFPPIIESTSNVNLACNLINNSVINKYAQVFHTFSPNVAFGEQIQETPFFPIYLPIADGVYNDLVLTFYDENLVPLNIQDPHITGTLIIQGI